jgi:glycosyltransferase involved in cell wall biosynthesis
LKNKVKILIFNEKFWGEGLAFTQSIKPYFLLKNLPKYKLEVIGFVSVLNLIIDYKKIISFKKEAKSKNIDIKIIPIFFLMSRLFLIRWWLLPWLIINTLPLVIYYKICELLTDSKIVFHLRSYPLPLIFSLIKWERHKIIFDPRSDYIGENTYMGIWKKNSLSERLWYKFENRIVNLSNRIIFISRPMMNEITNRTNTVASNKSKVIYNPVSFKHFNPNSYIKDEHLFLYSGSLGNWNNILIYLNFFNNIREYIPEAKLLILNSTTGKKRDELLKSILKYNRKPGDIKLLPASYAELPQYYAAARFGLQLMEKADNRVGVKFVEYVASNVIPIVNKNVKGAYDLVKAYQLGIALDELTKINYEQLSKTLISFSGNIRPKGFPLFDENSVLNSLLQLYEDLFNE